MKKNMTIDDFLPYEDLYSRRLMLPDGSTCDVELAGWYWNALDYFAYVGKWDHARFIRLTWRATKKSANEGLFKPVDFAEHFAKGLAYMISRYVEQSNHLEVGVANDIF